MLWTTFQRQRYPLFAEVCIRSTSVKVMQAPHVVDHISKAHMPLYEMGCICSTSVKVMQAARVVDHISKAHMSTVCRGVHLQHQCEGNAGRRHTCPLFADGCICSTSVKVMQAPHVVDHLSKTDIYTVFRGVHPQHQCEVDAGTTCCGPHSEGIHVHCAEGCICSTSVKVIQAEGTHVHCAERYICSTSVNVMQPPHVDHLSKTDISTVCRGVHL